MELCEKKYPYPVLLPKGDDYVDCLFEVSIESVKTPTEITFQLETKLNCPDLRSAVDRGDAAIILHVECPQSAYRKSFSIPIGPHCLPPISSNDLSGKISLCPFIVAQKEIKGFHSDSFNPIYKVFSFNIRCGSVLAEGEQLNDFADTATRDIDYKPDIFSVVPYSPAPEDGERIRIDPFDSKIKIALPRNAYAQYNAMLKSGEVKEFLWSSIILPAVMEALHQMQREFEQNGTFGDLEQHIWCQKIVDRIEHLHPEAKSNKEQFFKDMNIPEIAQEIIKNPVATAISKLASFGGTKEDEDEN